MAPQDLDFEETDQVLFVLQKYIQTLTISTPSVVSKSWLLGDQPIQLPYFINSGSEAQVGGVTCPRS